MPIIILLCFTILAVITSFFIDKNKTIAGLKKGHAMFFNLLPPLVTIVILLSFMLFFVPKEFIISCLGKNSGIYGIFIAALTGSISLIPGFIAFPLCNILLNTMKIPMLTFEMGFLGLKFTLLRTLISLPVFIVIAFILEIYLKNKNFEVKEPSMEDKQ